jgi:hypothetical protein
MTDFRDVGSAFLYNPSTAIRKKRGRRQSAHLDLSYYLANFQNIATLRNI